MNRRLKLECLIEFFINKREIKQANLKAFRFILRLDDYVLAIHGSFQVHTGFYRPLAPASSRGAGVSLNGSDL